MCNTLIIQIVISVQFLSGWSISQLTQNTTSDNYPNTMEHENHYPRIEFYKEKDYADPNSGNGKIIDPNGKTYYMGARDYQPYIDRTTYLLNKQQAEELLNSPLVFLPYFGEIKPDITLGHYFKMSVLQDLPQRLELFPRSMDKYLSYPEDERIYYQTLIGYKNLPPFTVTVIWLDKNTWYVDNVFYRIDLDEIIDKTSEKIVDKQLVEGTMTNFINHSFVIQPKLNERKNYLKTVSSERIFKSDEVVLEIALTPGGPGSISFSYTFYADGKISTPGLNYYAPSSFISHHRWIGIQNELRKIDFEKLKNEHIIPQFVHDGHTYIIGAFYNDGYYRLNYGYGSPMPEKVIKFLNYVLKIVEKLESEKYRK